MKNLTEIVFILDKSGSMCGLEEDTIGGFNSMIKKHQQKKENEALVSTVLFDTDRTVIHDRVPLGEVKPMTEEDYETGGCTALLDALGSAIHHIGSLHREAKEEDRPQSTLFVIITDGEENSSKEYTFKNIRKTVERQRDKYGWEFIFLGANMDAIAAASKVGIRADRAVRYECDREGTALNFKVVERVMKCTMECCAPPPDWKDEIEEDRRRRGKNRRHNDSE